MSKRSARVRVICKCPYCGKEKKVLRTYYNKQKCIGKEIYCCRDHSMLDKYGQTFRKPTKILDPTVCVICNEQYIPKSLLQKACSKPCQDKMAKNKYEENKRITDFIIFERDHFRCAYCGKSSIEDEIRLVIDHVYPRNKNGDNHIYNLTTSCLKCNNTKTDKILDAGILERIYEKNMRSAGKIIKLYPELQERLNKRWAINVTSAANQNSPKEGAKE